MNCEGEATMAVPEKPLKWYKKMANKKGRLESGAFLVEGDRAIRQIMKAQPGAITEVISVAEPPPDFRDYPRRLVSVSQFNAMCSTRTPQGIMAVVKEPPDIYADRLPGDAGGRILLLEDIQDPGNIGTLIRTAAAFGYAGVVLTNGCADPLSPKCVQATSGTILSLWLRRTANYLELANALRNSGYPLIAAELNGTDGPSILHGRDKLMLALGNEAAGLSPALLEVSDYRVRLPVIREKAESLNVAACGAICMYLSSL
ncbi:TrmH family RNA methyltransferase [Chloroflexota bacterium]